ncbi:MAG: cob(I)yrinic acid a,c-diamide adenosyltransferase [Planctomycetota bacterium]|jgi:cob(I)alamin adenosyltransferase
MKLYTKGGDDGTTGLFGGRRVRKSDLRVRACGEVDETNAAVGVAIAHCRDDELVANLRRIQSDLFALGAQLATPGGGNADTTIDDAHIGLLERWIDAACDEVPDLQSFVLPGGSETGADLHLARTVCRRAERTVAALAEKESIERAALVYLNRLSDLMFALARQANHRAGLSDIPWPAPKTVSE